MPMEQTSIPYVPLWASDLSEEWETALSSLPEKAGVIFVSVEAVPAPMGKVTRFRVVMGMSRKVGGQAGHALVHRTLGDAHGYSLEVLCPIGSRGGRAV